VPVIRCAGMGASATTHPGRTRTAGKALTVALVAGFMTLLAVNIVDVALPPIRAGLNPSAGGPASGCCPHTLTVALLPMPAGGPCGGVVSSAPLFVKVDGVGMRGRSVRWFLWGCGQLRAAARQGSRVGTPGRSVRWFL